MITREMLEDQERRLELACEEIGVIPDVLRYDALEWALEPFGYAKSLDLAVVSSSLSVTSRHKRRLFIQALLDNNGDVKKAAKAIGVARGTPYVWASDDDAFKAKWQEVTQDIERGQRKKHIERLHVKLDKLKQQMNEVEQELKEAE